MLIVVFFNRILIVFFLANYLHLIDETRLTLNYMISSLLYEEALSFPIELVCVEFVYLIASIAFEVKIFISKILILIINDICRVFVWHVMVQHRANVCFVYVFWNVIIFKYKRMGRLLLNLVQSWMAERKNIEIEIFNLSFGF